MRNLEFKYGNGKTVELCQTAYNYKECGGKVVIMNAKNNEPIISKLDNYYGTALHATITDNFDNNLLYEKAFGFKENNIDAILIDNAHYITDVEVEQLFFISKLLNIRVICYGNRNNSIRLMELSNSITKVDGDFNDRGKSKIQFYYGAMNCSKTAKLLVGAKDLENKGKRICLIKPKSDRDEQYIKSRVGLSRKADIVLDTTDDINYDNIENREIILVDEAQFLTRKQIERLYQINRNFNIPIKCYGLKSDFLTHLFSGSERLLELSDELIQLNTLCRCKDKVNASFNARKQIDGDFLTTGNQIEIDDGKGKIYISLCDICYIKDVLKIDIDNPKKLIKRFM